VFVQVHDHGWFAYVSQRSGPAHLWLPALFAAMGIGALACAILVANNLRDIPSDREVGKRTLAVALGDGYTRRLYAVLVSLSIAALAGVALTTDRAVLLGLVSVVPLSRGVRTVTDGASGPALVPVLQQTGMGELLYAVGMFAGLLAAR
jgi:1,4-dihydroxy-2-naphthoate octaprenyltransferase